MFVALLCSSTVIAVFQVDNLRVDSRNVRTMYDSYSAERGPILVDGQPIAESKPADDQYNFQRVYSNPQLYSAVTGYFTLNQGTTGVESALNDHLSGTANDQFLDKVNAILSAAMSDGTWKKIYDGTLGKSGSALLGPNDIVGVGHSTFRQPVPDGLREHLSNSYATASSQKPVPFEITQIAQ